MKKKAYRDKEKARKNPQQQIVQQVVEQVVEQVAPTVVKQVAQESKSKITNFFKPATKVEYKTQSKITGFFVSKEQFFKNVKTEPIKDLITEIQTTIKKAIQNQKLLLLTILKKKFKN